MEKKLAGLYNELASKLISIIPAKWEEIYYLGEVELGKSSWSSVFYFKEKDTQQYVKSHEIPKRYDVSEEIYNQLSNDLDLILLKLYDCFLENGQELWEQLSFFVNTDGEFNIDYLYDKLKDNDKGQIEREVIWAYKTFGFKPKEGSYMRKLLDKNNAALDSRTTR